MPKITPFLWFDNQAEEAAAFYTSIFNNSSITDVVRYGEAGPGPAGKTMIVAFQLDGQHFRAFNGGPQFQFTEAVSFVVNCDTQAEIDYYWNRLTEGGEEQACGWLKDKYGVVWQIVPSMLRQLMNSGDPEKSASVTRALLQMKKLDIAALQDAYEHPY